MSVTVAESEDLLAMDKCKDIAETLNGHYPGYLWAVRYYGGAFIIKNFNLSTKWGFVLKYKDVTFDSAVLRKWAIAGGGELLERCHLPRGPRPEGAVPKVFEGARNWRNG